MLPHSIIGIDLGTNCGWAILRADGSRVDSGTWRLGNGTARLVALRDHAADILRNEVWEHRKENVVLCHERVVVHPLPKKPGQRHRGTAVLAAQSYGGLRDILRLAIHDAGVRAYSLLPQQWKKTAVNHGNASKPLYIQAANDRYGLSLTLSGEDEAAALGVAYACFRELGGPQLPITGEQREIA